MRRGNWYVCDQGENRQGGRDQRCLFIFFLIYFLQVAATTAKILAVASQAASVKNEKEQRHAHARVQHIVDSWSFHIEIQTRS